LSNFRMRIAECEMETINPKHEFRNKCKELKSNLNK